MPVPLLLRLLLATCLLGTTAPALGAEAAMPARKAAVTVKVDRVRPVVSVETVPVLGRIVALRGGPIAAEVGGIVETVYADVGARVAAGAPLIGLETEPLRLKATVARAEEAERTARVAEARALARITQSELERLEKLRNSVAFTPSRYADKQQDAIRAQAVAQAAEADRRIATANRKLAERDLARAVIAAPYAGVVVERRTDVGAYVAKGDAPVVLVGERSVEVEAEVSADLVAHGGHIDRPVAVDLGGGHTVSGTVRAVLPRENPRTRTRIVRISLPSAQLRHTPAADHTVGIAFPAGARTPRLSVAKDAVIRREGQSIVMIASAGSAEIRPVRLGAAVGERFVVEDGLAEGDLAVVRGNERLAPGTPLTFQDAP